MSKFGKSLLSIIIFMLIAVVTAIGIMSSMQFSKLITSSLTSQTESAISTFDNEMNQYQEDMRNYVDVLADNPDMVNATAQKNAEVISQCYAPYIKNSAVEGAIADKDGNIIWESADIVGIEMSDVTDDDFYAKEGESLYYIAQSDIVNDAGNQVGTAFMCFNFSDSKYVQDIKTASLCEVTLYSGNIRIASTNTKEDGSSAVGTAMSEETQAIVLQKGETFMGEAVIFGRNHMCKYKPIKNNSGKILGAYFTGITTTKEDNMLTSAIVLCIVMAVIGCVASSLIITMVVNKNVIRPVVYASKIADKMSEGNLTTHESDIQLPNNEIGDMVRNLENTKKDLFTYITDMTRVMGAMGEGDFTQKPQIDYIGDFKALQQAMTSIQNELGNVVNSLNLSATEVSSGSYQIATGSQLLADGTTRQAAAIEQLSATINDISEKIKNNASNAKQAEDYSMGALDKVKFQSEEMSEMRAAMNDIKEKSDRAASIINNIKDIAFQTNILALNAAVEAARAGDAGKGFAVVADEVRTLATKSDEATKQTASIIESTIEAVDRGTKIAEESEKSMVEVSDMTIKTNEFIKEISTACDEQAAAVVQVTTGLSQISEVIQQNSATAEESAASCEELNGQASMLKEQVDKFKVTEAN